MLAVSYGGAFALENAVAAYRAGWLRSRHARPFLRRPQRPGTHDAFTLWEPLGNSPSTLLSQALGKTVAEPALRDHWQRDVHACSESTFSHSEFSINKNSWRVCAKAVDDGSSLWKMAENLEKIQDRRSKCIRRRK
jgi:hypothetical protein